MGKKRSGGSAEEQEPNKKQKFTEFNGTVFKKMLKDPTEATKGLEKFVSTAKLLPSSELYDVVEGYMKISMECSEIFRLMESERLSESELMLIFESLEVILLRTATDLSHFGTVGNAIVKKTVSSHMRTLLSSLLSSNHRFVRQSLSFLSSLVAQGPEAAREVFSHIHSFKNMSALSKRRDRQGKPDVRMAFVQFVLSFLVSGDNATVAQVLEVKELLPEILSSGLKDDRLSVVNLILSTLKSRVVLNKGLSKTHKVRFFSAAVLLNLASLYRWTGLSDAEADDSTENTGLSLVRELVHTFLTDLCCSRKHGISFYDSSLGTAGRPGNLVLLQFLVGLRQAPEDPLVCELLVKVLRSSPDVLSRYFRETQHCYSPRAKSSWQDHVSLMKKIYEAQPDISSIFQTQEVVPTTRLLRMIHVLSLPPVCTKIFFTQGLNLSSTAVQLSTSSVLKFLLQRAFRDLRFLEERAEAAELGDLLRGDLSELIQLHRESLSKIVPDLTTVVGRWQSLSKKEKEPKSAEDGAAAEQAPDSAEVIVLKATILQVLCLYQRVLPHLVAQCKFDFSKLLKGLLSERGLQGVPPVLQVHVLQLALELPSSKFSWFRSQDSADGDSSEKSVLFQILNMFASSSRRLRSFTRKLLLKVLKDSGVFEFTGAELELWLDQLLALDPNQRETVLRFLEKVLLKLVSSSHVYTDRVAALVQEAAFLQNSLSGNEADHASVPVSHIDDVLDMLDVIMETSEGQMEEFGPALSEDLVVQTFPFSALVPAALEARNRLDLDRGAVFEYLCTVLTQILHSQRDPLPLVLALAQFDKGLSSPLPHRSVLRLQRYYSRWLPPEHQQQLQFQQMEVQPENPQSPETFSSALRDAFVRGPSALTQEDFLQTLEQTLGSVSLTELPVTLRQTLLYIRTTVDEFGNFSRESGAVVLENLMKTLQLLVKKLLQLHEAASEPEEPPPEETELFLDEGQTSEEDEEEDREQMLSSGLSSVLKDPCLQQWFLALELSSCPPQNLNPVRLKQLCSLMTDQTLTLLRLAAPRLQTQPDLLRIFSDAIVRAVLLELREIQTSQTQTQSRPMLALLQLHSFMAFSEVMEVVSQLLLLPQLRLVSADGAELTVYGQVALQVLTHSRASESESLSLSRSHLQGLGSLFLSCHAGDLEVFLLQTLVKDPSCAHFVPAEVLLRCVREERAQSRTIARLLLQNSSAHRLTFDRWCLEPGNVEGLTNDDTHLALVQDYLRLAQRDDPARPRNVREQVLQMLKISLIPKLSHRVLQTPPGTSGEDHVETLSRLIRLCADADDISYLCSSLVEALKSPAALERWRLVDVLSETLAQIPERSVRWRRSVLAAALSCLKASYGACKDPEASQSEQEQRVLDSLLSRLTGADDIAASDWNSFVKTGLKYRFRHSSFLTSLTHLLPLMYRNESRSELLPLSTLHAMSCSHSLFLPSLLDVSEEDEAAVRSKEALVSLLLELVQKCPSVCNVHHFVVLLGAYGASLSSTDQKLLLLLQEYERNDVSLLKFQSLMWGPAAVEHHRAKKSLGSSLWKQTNADELLALLRPEHMTQSIRHFPQHRKLLTQAEEPLFQTDVVKDLQTLYDPRFLLPLFSSALRPESVVDCLKFVSSDALGFTVTALSSYDHDTRAAAYHVLTSFYQHLEAARFKEKKQLLYLLEMVKNSVRQKNQRLPFVLTLYVSKVLQQLLRPEDHMFMVITRFLLSHQSLDLRRVPEFFKLFYGFDLEHRSEREWILKVLEEGLSDRLCFQLCEQQGIFQSLTGFCSSALSHDNTEAQIIRVLTRAASVTSGAYSLTSGCGLLSWITQLLLRRTLDQQLLGAVIELLHVLWTTNLGQKETQLHRLRALPEEERPEKPVRCLPQPLICEFLCVASAVTERLRLGVKSSVFSLFVEMFRSVLSHYAASVDRSVQRARCTLLPEPLSCSDALNLLLCWTRLNQDTLLLSELQRLDQKHQLRLFNAAKDKGHVKGSKTRSRKQTEETGPEEDQLLKDCPLSRCPLSLTSVLCHWTPVSSSSCSGGQTSAVQTEPSDLSKDMALLLTAWTLRTLLKTSISNPSSSCSSQTNISNPSSSCSSQTDISNPSFSCSSQTDISNPSSSCSSQTQLFLRWLQTLTSHQTVVDVLMMDDGVRANLLRLYHREFESDSAETRDLRLFTQIMVRLSERRGPLPSEHRAVVSSCLTEEEQEDEERQRSTREAGLFLSSLYVHELWSGDSSAEIFMSHVRSVTDHRNEKKKKTPELPGLWCPTTAICDRIISSASH